MSLRTLFLRLSFIVLCVAACGWLVRTLPASHRLEVLFFAVGQGDGALLRLPGGRTLLVDAGGGFGTHDVGERWLVRELAGRWLGHVDDAILSHPDQDHGYGFLGIFAAMPVRRLWLHEEETREDGRPLAHSLVAAARLRGGVVHAVATPVAWEENGVTVRILPFSERGRNNRFLALDVRYRGCRFVFAADAEKRGEQAWLRSRVADLGPVHVLKVPHHGSRTSSSEEFLARVRPRWAVVSCGLGNSYGHPHREVLARYRRWRADVVRTDFHGFVRFFVSNDGTIRCSTPDGPCGELACAR